MEHVVWDWNGTLLADQQLTLDALNATLVEFGLTAVDMPTYQRVYTRPVHLMYERLFGRPMAPGEWERIDAGYHRAYHEALATVSLAHDAEYALERVAQAGRSQSLLSMYPHAALVPVVERLGIAHHFCAIQGLEGPGGGKKAAKLEAHVLQLSRDLHEDPSRIVIVGDALDDAEAAAHVGARVVLYDGGSHPRDELELAGVPVASSLVEALDLAGIPR